MKTKKIFSKLWNDFMGNNESGMEISKLAFKIRLMKMQ